VASTPWNTRLAQIITRALIRYAGWITIIGFGLGAIGAYFSVQLYKNLRTDIEELLPTTARSVMDLNEVTSRLESIENMAVIVLSNKPKESRQFVDAFARELAKAPRDRVAGIEYKIDRELEFFRSRRPLYMELSDLEAIRDYVRDRIQYEKQLYNPLNIFSGREIQEPQLDFGDLEKKYTGKVASYQRFPGGYYATPDEKIRVVLIQLPGKASGVKAAHALREEVDRALERATPSAFDPEMKLLFSGGVQNLLEEHAALIADLELSTIVVMILVTGILLVFFRAIRATLALMVALIVGTLWTFGVSYFAVGYLNANSAFLGAIVLGNGINFGIILLARYLEERRLGRSHLRSTRLAIESTATGTWTAALAAGLAYGSLILTGFRGFKQFGIIGWIGMLLCWLVTFTLLPALLTLIDRRRPLAKPERARKEFLGGWLAGVISRHPTKIWMGSFLLTIASLAMLMKASPEILETNLAKLRDKRSMESGSGHNSVYVDQVFQHYLTPIVVMPDSREHTREVASRLKAISRENRKTSLIASVQTLDDFVPKDQDRKIAVIREIQGLFTPRVLKELNSEDRNRVKDLMTPETTRTVHEEDLPPLILKKFTEKNGAIGKLVLVEPPMTNETWNGNALIRFIEELREVTDSVEPGAPVAGQLPVSSDMLSAIQHDGPRATVFALLAVVLLVIFLFRKFSSAALTLFSLFIGMAWMGGAIFGFWIKINFLNFIALPITFGIGVDYGVNVFQRYIQEGGKNISAVVKNTGGAVILASLTTIIGYGSLLIAGNQAFVSFGKLAVLGEITCVLAAVVSLPAYLIWSSERKARKRAKAAANHRSV
jgi:predicted RND superfamily exporter protein